MEGLGTSDYMGNARWGTTSTANPDDEEGGYPFPLVLKRRAGSVGLASGQTTPGGNGPIMNGDGKIVAAGKQKSLSQGDLEKADKALSGC